MTHSFKQVLDRRTEELAEAKEEFHRELSRKDQAQRAFAERVRQDRLELGMQFAVRAGQCLNRHIAVIDLYAKLLLKKQSEPCTIQYHERLMAGAPEAGTGATVAGLRWLPAAANPVAAS